MMNTIEVPQLPGRRPIDLDQVQFEFSEPERTATALGGAFLYSEAVERLVDERFIGQLEQLIPQSEPYVQVRAFTNETWKPEEDIHAQGLQRTLPLLGLEPLSTEADEGNDLKKEELIRRGSEILPALGKIVTGVYALTGFTNENLALRSYQAIAAKLIELGDKDYASTFMELIVPQEGFHSRVYRSIAQQLLTQMNPAEKQITFAIFRSNYEPVGVHDVGREHFDALVRDIAKSDSEVADVAHGVSKLLLPYSPRSSRYVKENLLKTKIS